MIIDSFPFFNEKELCKIRLNYLADTVDAFVITESNLTWRCRPNLKKFDEVYISLSDDIKKKIHYEFIEYESCYIDSEEHSLNKTIQNKSRDRLVTIAKNISKEALYFYSDLDEIWDIRGLDEIKKTLEKSDCKQIVCNMDFRVVFLDWQARQGSWPGTRITKLESLPEETPLSRGPFSYTKSSAWKRHTIINNGWHFSYFGSNQQRLEKISNIKNAIDWEKKVNLSYDQIASSVNTLTDWNRVVRKKKIQGRQIENDMMLDDRLSKEFEKYKQFYSNNIRNKK